MFERVEFSIDTIQDKHVAALTRKIFFNTLREISYLRTAM